jgi:hypothetical protein
MMVRALMHTLNSDMQVTRVQNHENRETPGVTVAECKASKNKKSRGSAATTAASAVTSLKPKKTKPNVEAEDRIVMLLLHACERLHVSDSEGHTQHRCQAAAHLAQRSDQRILRRAQVEHRYHVGRGHGKS